MEGLSGRVFACFSHPGRIAGVLVGIRRRMFVIGICRRGIFYRFGARAINPARGYWDSVFGLRTRIKQIEMMMSWGMRDETVPVRFRPSWIHGSIHYSRTGILTFIVTATDPEIFSPEPRKNPEIFSSLEVEDTSYYEPCQKERY